MKGGTLPTSMAGAHPTLGMVIRLAVIGGWALRLIATTDRRDPWVGPFPALLAAIAVAIAIVMEPRAWLRRLALGLVVALLYTYYVRANADGVVRLHSTLALITLGETVLVVGLLETRLWRWSLAPGIALAFWLLIHLLPGYIPFAGDATEYRVTWLVHALLLLCANGGWRSIRAELEEDRARSAGSTR